jgi:hypothetical protein
MAIVGLGLVVSSEPAPVVGDNAVPGGVQCGHLLFRSTEVRGTVGKHVLDGLATLLPVTDAQAPAAAAQSAVLRDEA